MADSKGPSRLPVTVQKPTPYTFDLGLLLAEDPNPLLLTTTSNLEDDLAATARDGAQSLLNQLLTTCPISSTPSGVLLSLPETSTKLPREKVRFCCPSSFSFLSASRKRRGKGGFVEHPPPKPTPLYKHLSNSLTQKNIAAPTTQRTHHMAKIRRQERNQRQDGRDAQEGSL